MIHPDAVRRAYRQLCAGLADPETLPELTETDWDALLPVSRSARLFSRLAALAERRGLLERLPPPVDGHMRAVLRLVADRRQKILWELRQLERTLKTVEAPVLLLKGTAYLVGGLAAAPGRIFGDVDLLVPRADLDAVERVLRAAGWRAEDLDAYDQRYYREWMHEIPALSHPERGVEVDIHHTISPLTSQLKVDAGPFFATARAVDGHKFRVPAPADLILHSAVHLFYGGEFENGLRDLSDLDLLLRESAAEPGFWPGLVARAGALGLERPLFYALHYTHGWLATPMPDAVLAQAREHGPGRTALAALDALFEAALFPPDPTGTTGRAARARWVLWVRSHWLKMPPGLLLRHLWHKAGKRGTHGA